MVQNRNKLIDLFIGNIANAIVHEILENALSSDVVADKYRKELTTSFEIAKNIEKRLIQLIDLFPIEILNTSK